LTALPLAERQVVALSARGEDDASIAKCLHLSQTSVRVYRHRAIVKLRAMVAVQGYEGLDTNELGGEVPDSM
jgi:DNA-binding CsgD family transcriptional regulator